jgi:hypothetical protein
LKRLGCRIIVQLSASDKWNSESSIPPFQFERPIAFDCLKRRRPSVISRNGSFLKSSFHTFEEFDWPGTFSSRGEGTRAKRHWFSVAGQLKLTTNDNLLTVLKKDSKLLLKFLLVAIGIALLVIAAGLLGYDSQDNPRQQRKTESEDAGYGAASACLIRFTLFSRGCWLGICWAAASACSRARRASAD